MISSMPVLARPEAMMKQPAKKHPVRLITRFPRTSAIEPAKSKQEPLVSLSWSQQVESLMYIDQDARRTYA